MLYFQQHVREYLLNVGIGLYLDIDTNTHIFNANELHATEVLTKVAVGSELQRYLTEDALNRRHFIEKEQSQARNEFVTVKIAEIPVFQKALRYLGTAEKPDRDSFKHH